MSTLSSDNVHEVLKIILLAVIGICVVGLILWYISDKYPLYAAKKEVTMALSDLARSYAKWAPTAEDPVTIDYITSTKQWVVLDAETKMHWSFELIGDPATRVVAQSLPGMPGGRDRYVYADIATGHLWGWGIKETEDSIKAGLLKPDAYYKPQTKID